MAKTGRKQTLENRVNTSINLERYHIEYLDALGIERSQFFRDCVDNFIKANESTKEVLLRQKKEMEEKMQEMKEQMNIVSMQLEKLEEVDAKVVLEAMEEEEFEVKRKDYIRGCTKMMRENDSYTYLWITHLKETWKFANTEEAVRYIYNVWIEKGESEYRVKKFLRLT